jgi:hypothetical protein
MALIVVDANSAVRWFLPDEADPEMDALLERIIRREDSALVPSIFYGELFSALYQASRENRGYGHRTYPKT